MRYKNNLVLLPGSAIESPIVQRHSQIGLAITVMERSLSDDVRQMYKLKQAAVEFYRAHGVPQNLEEALNSLFHQQPEDVYGQLVNHFSVLCKPAVVKRIEAWQALDTVGCPAVAVQLICTTRNMEQRVCSLVMASEGEPPDTMALGLKDQEYSKKQESSQLAVQWINHSLSGFLMGQQPYNQSELDCLLREFLKEKLSEVHQQQEQEEVTRTEFSEPVVQPLAVTVNSDKKPIKGKKSAALEKPLFHKEMRAPLLPGSVAISATSMAIAKAAARLKSCPLYKHIASLSHTEVQQKLKIPVTMVTVLCCGKASPGKLNLLKEVMVLPRPGLTASQGLNIISEIQHQIMKHAEVVPKTGTMHVVGAVGAPLIGCDKLERPLEIIEEVARSLGLTAGVDFHLALNCAAHEVMDYEKGRYEVASGSFKATTDMVELYVQLLGQHPAVVALIDPLCPEDHEQWRRLSSAVGEKCFIFNENFCRLAELENLEHITGTLKATGVIIKHTNQVTVSDLLQASRYLQGKGLCVAFGACSGDTPDGSLVDMVRLWRNVNRNKDSKDLKLVQCLCVLHRVLTTEGFITTPCVMRGAFLKKFNSCQCCCLSHLCNATIFFQHQDYSFCSTQHCFPFENYLDAENIPSLCAFVGISHFCQLILQ